MNSPTFLISAPGGAEWVLVLIALPLYFLPTIVAGSRKSQSSAGIFVVNFLLGWTFIGWIGALIWALSSRNVQGPTVIVNNSPQAYSQEYTVERHETPSQTALALDSSQASNHQHKIDQLRQLKQLLDDGVLTLEEFNKQKSAVLG